MPHQKVDRLIWVKHFCPRRRSKLQDKPVHMACLMKVSLVLKQFTISNSFIHLIKLINILILGTKSITFRKTQKGTTNRIMAQILIHERWCLKMGQHMILVFFVYVHDCDPYFKIY